MSEEKLFKPEYEDEVKEKEKNLRKWYFVC